MKILFLGDIAANPGRLAVKTRVPQLRQSMGLDAVVANAENAAHGHGITAEIAQELFACGVDVITLGDHAFDQRGSEDIISNHPRIVRPANYPTGTLGRGHTLVTLPNGQRLGVIQLQGRVFTKNQIDCPFQLSKTLQDQYILGKTCDALVLDLHAEATAEKYLLGHVWDGKASLVVGTHTHIPTADHHIMPGGTGFQCDAGMCGDYNSSLGMSFASVLPSMTRVGRYRFEPAGGPGTLCGVVVETGANGLATSIHPVRAGGILEQTR
jgi:metallophosphoesterase (TIGR00282 family)